MENLERLFPVEAMRVEGRRFGPELVPRGEGERDTPPSGAGGTTGPRRSAAAAAASGSDRRESRACSRVLRHCIRPVLDEQRGDHPRAAVLVLCVESWHHRIGERLAR
jgi:hypothetical protein